MPDYNRVGKRFTADSRMINEINRSPTMRAEQGGGAFMSAYGGVSAYSAMAKMKSPEERQVYAAVNLDGLGNASEIAQATGLSESKVNATITKLNAKGLVSLKAEPVQL